VRAYNQRVESLPSNLVARLGGFPRHDYFEIDPAIRTDGDRAVEHSE
jgi:hypothetical protein